MLVVSPEFKCSNEVLSIVAMLSGEYRSPYFTNVTDLCKCPMSGYVLRIRQPEWVLFNEFAFTTRYYIRTVTAIKPQW